VSILSKSTDADDTEKKLGVPKLTEADIEPVDIKEVFPPVPGSDEVTNKALLTASYITVLTFIEGEYGKANEGT
jgi:hypothetical protein